MLGERWIKPEDLVPAKSTNVQMNPSFSYVPGLGKRLETRSVGQRVIVQMHRRCHTGCP